VKPPLYGEERVRRLATNWGRAVYEAQPDGPAWAASVLAVAQDADSDIPEVLAIVEIARYPSERHLAHDAFTAARVRSLATPKDAKVRLGLLRLAEVVAKAAWNDVNTTAPFDFNAPSKIAPYAVVLAETVAEPRYCSFMKKAVGTWPTERDLA
jgi:hypothetical protein